MNVLMSVLKAPFAEAVLVEGSVRERVSAWCQNMCRLFRN